MLVITKHLLDEAISHCRSRFPDEACGIFAGRNGRVEKVYAMTNADKSSETFLMDPKEQLRVVKETRCLGLEMVGIYHSHVASQAYPSSHDVRMAFYPEVSYVIVSLKDMAHPETRSFRISEGRISEEDLRVE